MFEFGLVLLGHVRWPVNLSMNNNSVNPRDTGGGGPSNCPKPSQCTSQEVGALGLGNNDYWTEINPSSVLSQKLTLEP